MITPQRQEILRLLKQLSELIPDVRFGQLIANLSYLAVGPTNEAIWDMEDEQLVVAIRKHIANLSEYRLETDPRFLQRIDAARRSLAAGRGVSMEELSVE